jgi:hypothetical protein
MNIASKLQALAAFSIMSRACQARCLDVAQNGMGVEVPLVKVT